MRKIVYNMFLIMLLFICTMSLVSCEAISSQNININSSEGNTGGQRMNDGPRANINQGTPENFKKR